MEKTKTSRALIAWIAILSLAVSALIGTTIYYAVKPNPALDSMENVYHTNFYSLTASIDGIEENLSLMEVATSKESKQRIANRIWRQSGEAAAYLASLPVNHNELSETYVLINRLGDYLYDLSSRLSYGEELTQTDHTSLQSLYKQASQVKQNLNALIESMDEYSFMENLKQEGHTPIDGAFTDQCCPQLDYEGVFSESAERRDFSALQKYEELSKEKCLEKILPFFPDAIYYGESDDQLPCYVYVTLRDGFVSVTKHGGLIAQYSVEQSEKHTVAELQSEEAAQAALEFASRAYGKEFSVRQLRVSGNAAILCLMPKESEVFYATEMIQVKVDLTDGSIIGVSALPYLSGLSTHETYAPQLSAAEAALRIHPVLADRMLGLTVIKQGAHTRLVYVFSGEVNGRTYAVYVDAMDGTEVDVMRMSDEVTF